MAALLAVLVGCNKEPQNVLPDENGQKALIQVDVKTAGTLTKAPGTYEYGSAEENAVSSLKFYFFKADGNPYSVVSGSNEISWKQSEGETAESVEKISDVILVIKQSEVAPPAKVVAVLNDATDYANFDLATLASKVITSLHTDKTNFVMSNAVYYDTDTKAVMVASEITQDNIFTVTDSEFVRKYNAGSSVSSADIPEGVSINPIDIYVERVAAKVRVKGAEGVNLEKLPVYAEDGKTQMKDAFGNVVYAKILGWNITNCTDEAYLLKNVEASWTDASLGFAWNNPAHFRSYWTKTTDAPVHPHSFTALAGRDVVTEDYYFENTHSTEHAQLLVAAQLVNEEGAAIQLAKWYNVLYTIADLKTAMINTVATKLYIKDAAWTDANKVYRSVTTEDVTFYQVPVTTETKRYEVKVAVKEGVQYFYADGTAYEANKPEEILGNIAPAQMWTDGSAYYYTEIKHFGSEGKAGEFGIVRNHVYDVTLSGVKGFGTPVYDPELVIIPERPEKQEALNLAAQINILSWHLVAQDVTLQ